MNLAHFGWMLTILLMAELVQNSLDAGATRVQIHRKRIRKAVALVIRDDGEGVLPNMDRVDALNHLATNIGHSRKMGLDLAQRAGTTPYELLTGVGSRVKRICD